LLRFYLIRAYFLAIVVVIIKYSSYYLLDMYNLDLVNGMSVPQVI